MDTFMANLSSEVGVVLKENISIIMIISMLSTAAYNALETVFITFDIVKNHRALYFWSMQAASWGTLVHALPAIICCASQASTLPTSILFIIGWYAMVTGQAVILYSRLRLVVFDTSKVRWVLWMIFANVCILHIPMTILFFGRIGGDARLIKPAAIYNRIQLVGFCVQESVICCIYLYEVVHNLIKLAVTKAVMPTHLLCVSGLVFALNILVLLTEYKLQFIQVGLQTVIYSIKLKLEFTLLYHLRAAMHSDPLVFPLDRMQHRWSSNNTHFLNMNPSPTSVALEVIGPSGADPAGGRDRCHSLSSGTPVLLNITKHYARFHIVREGLKGARVLNRYRLAQLT
ncbi:hypothetical protein N7486_002464 [Penicillium sp. IBT 16267x]|nr:hypothetical protein N7486_002464 [Penicillium sp. IBT 16267x]